MRAALGIAVAAIVFAACGGASEEDTTADDLGAQLLADPVFVGYGVDPPVAECTAEAVVTDLGADRVDAVLARAGEVAPAGVPVARFDGDEFTALVEALAGCLEAGDVDVAAVLAGAVADGVLATTTEEFSVSEDEAACVGDEVVDALGVASMIALGLEGGDIALDEDRSGAFVDAFLACTDVRSLVVAGISDGDVDAEVLACLDVAITDEQVAELFALGFRDDAAGATRTSEVLQPAIDFCTA